MKALTERIADACNTHDIRNILGLVGRDKVILCPLPQHAHHKNTPSFSIFWRGGKQWWRCHGSCDTEGDVVDLIGYLRVPLYNKRDPAMICEAVEMIDDRFEVSIPQPEKEVILSGREYLKFLPPGEEAIQYAQRRGLLLPTIDHFRLGQSGHYLTMPLFEDGILRGVKMRNLWRCDPDYRYFQLEGSRLGLFNYDHVYLRPGVVFIVKGEIPAMLLHQLGFYACAPTGGEGSYKGQSERWRTALALAEKVVIGDNDGPGRVLAKKRALLFDAALVFPPDPYKDVDEFFLEEPEKALRMLNQWQDEAQSKF